MRLFVAINLTADVRRALYAAAEPLRAAIPRAGWVAEDRLHLTVRFLDDQPESLVPRLRGALEEVAARHDPVTLTLQGFGAFPNLRRPRVVWLGVESDPRVELLHHDVEEKLATLGFDPEGRAFRPHLTLARLRGGESPESIRALTQAARSVRFRAESCVDSIDLMHSVLGQGGPRYTRLVAAPLGQSRRET